MSSGMVGDGPKGETMKTRSLIANHNHRRALRVYQMFPRWLNTSQYSRKELRGLSSQYRKELRRLNTKAHRKEL